jgi:hypothetical protein
LASEHDGKVSPKERLTWYYEESGKMKGPISFEKLLDFINTGRLNGWNYVWTPGMENWIQVYEFLSMDSDANRPPPLKAFVRKSPIWALAFAPLIGLIMQDALAPLLRIRFEYLWPITVGLNVALASWDKSMLARAGYETARYGNPAFVPIYMYKRSYHLEKDLPQLIIWILLVLVYILGSS